MLKIGFMKKLLLLFSLALFLGAFQTFGQDHDANAIHEAAKEAAVRDANILKKVDPATGETQFFRKATCPNSGQAILTAVEFCSKSGKFIEVASYGKVSCTKSVGTKAAATMVSHDEPKCTPQQRAACPAACAEACKTAKTDGSKARMVSNNN